MSTKAPKQYKQYSQAEQDEALAIFALESGREKIVTAVLSEAGIDVNFMTLKDWAYRSEKKRYARIKSEVEEHSRSQLADRTRRFAHLGAEVGEEALLQIKAKLDAGEISPKELPKIVHEAAVAAGIGIDKSELLSGRPTARVSTDFTGLLDELKGLGIEFIEGEAEEVEDDASELSQPPEQDLSRPALPAGDPV